MSKKNLEEYLGIVYDMEKSVYSQERLIERLKDKVEKLGIVKYEKPGYLKKSNVILTVLILIIAIVLGFVLGFWTFNYIKSDDEGFVKWIIVFGGIIFSFSFLCNGIYGIGRFLFDISDANRKYIAETNRITPELKQKAILQTQIIALQEELNESKRTLNNIYSVNIIHPKYRGLIPVSSFYEYFTTGICEQLGGADGAYNKYDIESRLDKIITQLDIVISKLDQIKSNQFMLYSAIKDVQNSNQKLYDSIENMSNTLNFNMDKIKELQKQDAKRINAVLNNSEVMAYNLERTRREVEYRNYVESI